MRLMPLDHGGKQTFHFCYFLTVKYLPYVTFAILLLLLFFGLHCYP